MVVFIDKHGTPVADVVQVRILDMPPRGGGSISVGWDVPRDPKTWRAPTLEGCGEQGSGGEDGVLVPGSPKSRPGSPTRRDSPGLK